MEIGKSVRKRSLGGGEVEIGVSRRGKVTFVANVQLFEVNFKDVVVIFNYF